MNKTEIQLTQTVKGASCPAMLAPKDLNLNLNLPVADSVINI